MLHGAIVWARQMRLLVRWFAYRRASRCLVTELCQLRSPYRHPHTQHSAQTPLPAVTSARTRVVMAQARPAAADALLSASSPDSTSASPAAPAAKTSGSSVDDAAAHLSSARIRDEDDDLHSPSLFSATDAQGRPQPDIILSAETIARHRNEWFIPASLSSQRTLNPIRAIVDKVKRAIADCVRSSALLCGKLTSAFQRNHNQHGKSLIPLSIGDPTVFGNLQPPPTALQELCRLTWEGKSNGYAPSTGTVAARTAIATRYSPQGPGCVPLTPGDVMICSGASGALHILLDALLDAGDNILLPKPGFSLYATIAGYLGVEVRYYDLLPDQAWECDLAQAASLVDSRTRCILLNNPSNPNGSNFSVSHLREICAFAREHKLLIVSDEIYADMVFAGQRFTPIASLAPEFDVPVVAVGGIAKQFVVPGWRIGWLLFHDTPGAPRLAECKSACTALTQIILGSNTLIQALLPSLLLDTPASYYSTLNQTLEDQSFFLHSSISNIPGLEPIEPQGAMYLMVRIRCDMFDSATCGDDVLFSAALLKEEMLFVLPGSCFRAPNFVRLVTCAPKFIMEQAVARLGHFCKRHRKESVNAVQGSTGGENGSSNAAASSGVAKATTTS